jgi:hypothetical protein
LLGFFEALNSPSKIIPKSHQMGAPEIRSEPTELAPITFATATRPISRQTVATVKTAIIRQQPCDAAYFTHFTYGTALY